MKRIIFSLAIFLSVFAVQAKTLVVYYSYTNNVHRIVNELVKQVDADVLRIEPAEKGLDYAANNYAIGSAQIGAIRNNPGNASSYPAIDPVKVDLKDYDCIIIGAPLWWSNMAAPLQSFLFQYGKEMSGKHIGLIVSSSSSGISGVESDAKRLIPDGKFFSSSLWIKSSQTSNSANLIRQWLKDIKYDYVSSLKAIANDYSKTSYTVYSISGYLIGRDMASIDNLKKGLYIINGKKIYKQN